MAKNPKFNVKLPSEAVRPLYAAAGVTDLAVEIARGYVTEAQVKVTDVQKKASQRVSSVDLEPKALQSRAVSLVCLSAGKLSWMPRSSSPPKGGLVRITSKRREAGGS